tara:strand:- start:923 stop:1054 length:132 start_codon:yes stop_codon:yes gene_type:complete
MLEFFILKKNSAEAMQKEVEIIKSIIDNNLCLIICCLDIKFNF